MEETLGKIYCQKCGKALAVKNFYLDREGKPSQICKNCITMHLDPFDPDTFVWILKEFNFPYSETEWNSTRTKYYNKKPASSNPAPVLGNYLAKMKLKQWKNKTWDDTERIAEEEKKQKEKQAETREKFQEQLKNRFEKGEINEIEYKTLMTADTREEMEAINSYNTPNVINPMLSRAAAIGSANQFNENYFIDQNDIPNPAAELTQEDKEYLAMKWGRLYRPEEWIELERKYEEMCKSFDIQDSDTIGALILTCKTYLKMNQAIDAGDYSSYQQLSRVYDSMRKSAKFTAVQNKEGREGEFNSVGELVVLCEKEGFIPRFATDIPQDKIDITIKDMNNYVRKLVTEDLGFGQQIEDAIKKIQIQQEMNQREEDYYNGEEEDDIKITDYEEYFNEIEEQRKQDLEQVYYEEGEDDNIEWP